MLIGFQSNIKSAFAKENALLDGLNAGAEKALDTDAEELEERAREAVRAGAADILDEDPVSQMTPSQNHINSVSDSNVQEIKDTKNAVISIFDKIAMANVNDSLNVRLEADEESEIVGKLYKDSAGEILERKNNWTKIRSGNLEGWAKDEYLFFGADAENEAKDAVELTATVEAETLRVREEADESAKIISLLAGSEEVKVLEEQQDFIKVECSDDTVGYVSREFVSVEYNFSDGETNEEIKNREAVAKEEKERKEQEAKEKKEKLDASRTTSTTTTNTGAIAAQTDDVTLLAALIQCESGWECYEGKLAVGAVVVNRAKGRYGSIFNAVYAPGQFGPAGSGKVAAVVAMGPSPTCIQAAQDAINGVSNVGGATHFRNIRSGYAGIVIGNHVFW
jgi:uncharacterized protein YgiM (DUF1202 family)